ncbi:MAG: malto-oligosyltrehalose trehalohydrolase [Gammaproteobacteria bacterium]
MTRRYRRLPFGAEIIPGAGVRFRFHAPALDEAAVVLADGVRIPMLRSEKGIFETVVANAEAGSLYRYEIGAGEAVPDPASRFQPEDVDGPSEVVDSFDYEWGDKVWRGRPWNEAIVYELHVGCFDRSGGYNGVQRRLDHFERLGVTAIELMPVADFAGARNWGYDGVLPYAPDSAYGRPNDLKRLIDACHARGLMVLLDVVYNHFGPSGNYLARARYAPDFFHPDAHTPWGAALAFDNPLLRRFFIENALYWLEEYHFDGLRLDAVHAIEDSPGGADFLRELAERVRGEIRDREVHLILENDRNEARWLPHAAPPRHYTAQWNDDFHHAAHCAVTDERDGYYGDYAERPAQYLARAIAEGFAYQGERSAFRDNSTRGEQSAKVLPIAFVNFLQNHDQIGNRAFGERFTELAAPESLRALYVLLFLSPGVPLLFMGEEWAAGTPFLYFCDFPGELGAAVREGRRKEFDRFAAFRDPEARARIPDPTARVTFLRSRLDWDELHAPLHAEWLAFISELIACRRRELVPQLAQTGAGVWRMLGEAAFAIEWPLARGHWRLAANLDGEPVNAPAEAGRLVYGDPANADVELAPWSVRVLVDE